MSILVLITPGFDENHVCHAVRGSRKAGIKTTVASLTTGPVRGKYGIQIMPDTTLDEVNDQVPAAVVIPGGCEELGNEPRVARLLEQVKITIIFEENRGHNEFQDRKRHRKRHRQVRHPRRADRHPQRGRDGRHRGQ